MNLRVAPRRGRFDAQARRPLRTGLYGPVRYGILLATAAVPSCIRAVHHKTCYPSPFMRSGGSPLRSHFFRQSCGIREPRRMACGRPRRNGVRRMSRGIIAGDHTSCAAKLLLPQSFSHRVPSSLAAWPAILSAPASAQRPVDWRPPRWAATWRPARPSAPVQEILIANRGEIACRVIKTARKMGIKTVAVYSDADKQRAACQDGRRGGAYRPAARRPVLYRDRQDHGGDPETGAEAVHPGYGFLSENRSSPRRWRPRASPSSARPRARSRRWATRSPRRRSRRRRACPPCPATWA
jgi:hypothetical protein